MDQGGVIGSLASVADLLQTYGGWGVAVFLGFACWRLLAYIGRLHNEQKLESKELVEALVTVRESLDAFKDVLSALANKQ